MQVRTPSVLLVSFHPLTSLCLSPETELMDILRTKKAQSPPPPSSQRATKKAPISSEMIEDSDEETGGGSVEPAVEAGQSTSTGGSENGQRS